MTHLVGTLYVSRCKSSISVLGGNHCTSFVSQPQHNITNLSAFLCSPKPLSRRRRTKIVSEKGRINNKFQSLNLLLFNTFARQSVFGPKMPITRGFLSYLQLGHVPEKFWPSNTSNLHFSLMLMLFPSFTSMSLVFFCFLKITRAPCIAFFHFITRIFFCEVYPIWLPLLT